jgi:hypothetical protein
MRPSSPVTCTCCAARSCAAARPPPPGPANKLQRKHHPLFLRLQDRRDDYLRFVANPAVPFDNNPAEQTIRMPKLRIKVSGSMCTMTGAEHFAAIRIYTATATRQGIGMLDALIHAATGNPWIPAPA